MGEIVHWVDIPGTAGTVMGRLNNPVNNRIAHMHVGGGHIDFGPENTASFIKFALVHPFKQVEVLLDGPVPVRTLGTWSRGSTLLGRDYVGRLVVDISL